ncbi:glycerophosphoryl diester phosphodiesterase [Nocardia transvalensis]|uniref:Glycerophosphoryl diester phosphodiesterase n=1 Tax=Nocardia transvalensis TaxID=37333 RepID=A0A7W9PA73_9NOCA|nr:glycerophosphodiester phosphodiesterase family protein [Nocardia transvalensis]MBB5912339.1 glycerophosphoryl diester phosphodiesterase [Nocardia transvalensis]
MQPLRTSSPRVRRVIAAAGCAVAVAALPACGDDSTSTTSTTAAPASRTVDLQAHRGGRGLLTEESLAAYAHALELGVSTLELDIGLTADRVPVIWHDATIQADKCTDTAPASPADPQYPYVGKTIHELTYAQVHTLDCSKKLANFPEQQPVPGNRIARLPELFDLVKSYPGAFETIRYNIETKIEAEHPEQTAAPQEFVDVILDEVDRAGATGKVEIQSFDWSSLPLVKRRDSTIPTVALYDDTTFKAGSRWLGPVRFEDHAGDPLGAIAALGANISSPSYFPTQTSPTKVTDPGFTFTADATYVRAAHEKGLQVVPWTVNDQATLEAQLDTGVDGVITDYPDRGRKALEAKGFPLPASYRK